jgi:hypothetical protein
MILRRRVDRETGGTPEPPSRRAGAGVTAENGVFETSVKEMDVTYRQCAWMSMAVEDLDAAMRGLAGT